MKITKFLALFSLLNFVLFFLFSQSTWADGSQDGGLKETDLQLDEIVVTATKTARELKDVTTNMTVITAEDIEGTEPTDIMDLLRQVPGLSLNGLGSSKASFYAGFRGIQPSSRGVLIMMDGIEMNDPSNYINVMNIPMNRIERIEVIKSPASVLYGPAGVGGIINVITKKPTQKIEGNVSFTAGDFSRKEPYLYLGGLFENGFYCGLDYWYLDTDGYRENSFTKQHVATPRLGYSNETLDIDFVLDYRNADYGFPGGLPWDDYKNDPKRATQPDCDGDSDTINTGLKVNWKIREDALLKFKGAYRKNNWRTEDFGFEFKGKDYYAWNAEADYQQALSILGKQNLFLGGVEYRDMHNNLSMRLDDYWSTVFSFPINNKAEIQERIWGVFLQDEISLTGNLLVNLGVRYDYIQTEYDNKLDASKSYDNSHSKWSPRLGFTYTVHNSLNFFGNYTEGIRTVNMSRSAFQLTENVSPEREKSLELGFRGSLFDRVDYSLAGFLINTEDKIVQTNIRYAYENAGEARSKGFEMAVGIDLPLNITAAFNYTYIDSKFTDFQTSAACYDDKYVPLVPKNMFGATLEWNHPVYGRVNGSFKYVDEKYLNNDFENLYEMDDYMVVNLKYTYTFRDTFHENGAMRLSVGVNNLFDEIYAEYGEIDGGLYAPGPSVWPADGRALFVSLAYEF